MPTKNIRIELVTETQQNIKVRVIDNALLVVERELNKDILDGTFEDFVQWYINQEPDYKRVPDKEKELQITFHSEIDPGTGESSNALDDIVIL